MEIENLKKAIEGREDDLEMYRSCRSAIESQSFSVLLYQQTEKEIEGLKKQRSDVETRLQEIRNEQSTLEEERKQTERLAEAVKEQIVGLNRKGDRFSLLCKKYEQYETDQISLDRLKKEESELTKKQQAVRVSLGELREQETGLRSLVKECGEKINGWVNKAKEFEEYARLAEDRKISEQEDAAVEKLEALFNSLT